MGCNIICTDYKKKKGIKTTFISNKEHEHKHEHEHEHDLFIHLSNNRAKANKYKM